jgi:hypothetical protein
VATKKLEVFISGSLADLKEYRQAAIDACFRVGVVPVAPEFMMATAEPFEAHWGSIDSSDAYMGIIGERYGIPLEKEDKSATELEYERAGQRGIPRLIFIEATSPSSIDANPESMVRLNEFKKKVRQSGVVKEFRSMDDFRAEVLTALSNVVSSLSRKAEPKAVLLLVPMARSALRAHLSSTLKRNGIEGFSVDDLSVGTLWADALTDAFRRADIVVADVTDANPNVMYELGFAQSQRKPTIILAEASSERTVPFYLGGYNILTYDANNLQSLEKPLTRFLQEYTKEEWRR